MKTKTIYQFEQDAADFRARWKAYFAKIRKLIPAKMREWLIEIGAL